MYLKLSNQLLIASLFICAIAIFVSVSLLPLFQILFLVSFLVLVLNQKKQTFIQIPQSAWALMAYILVTLISSIVNLKDLQGTSHAMGSIKYPLMGFFGIFIFKKLDLSQKQLKALRLATAIFLGSIWLAFIYSMVKVHLKFDLKTWQFGEFSELGNRIGGFTDIMRYGYGSAIVVLVLIACLLNFKTLGMDRLTNRYFLFATTLVGFLGIYFSYTRGAMLGLLVSAPVMLYFYNKKISQIISLVCGFLVSIMVVVALLGGHAGSRFLMSSNSNSNSIRISQYQSAWYAFLEKPILGYGPQQLKFHIKEIKDRYDLSHKEFVNEHSHNVFLEIMANTGFLGLMTFIFWLGLWTREVFLGSTYSKQFMIPVILFILLAGQFEMLMMAQTSTVIYLLYSLSFHILFRQKIEKHSSTFV